MDRNSGRIFLYALYEDSDDDAENDYVLRQLQLELLIHKLTIWKGVSLNRGRERHSPIPIRCEWTEIIVMNVFLIFV